jgi:hypothetical protein
VYPRPSDLASDLGVDLRASLQSFNGCFCGFRLQSVPYWLALFDVRLM